MPLVILQIRGSVSINGIFGIKWRHYGPKGGYFGLLRKDHILVYHPIISYQMIKVYRVETMDVKIFFWNNGVSGKFNPSKYCGVYCML